MPCTLDLLYLIFSKEYNKIPLQVGSVSPILNKSNLFNLKHIVDDMTSIRTQVFVGLVNDRYIHRNVSMCLSEAHPLIFYSSAWSPW